MYTVNLDLLCAVRSLFGKRSSQLSLASWVKWLPGTQQNNRFGWRKNRSIHLRFYLRGFLFDPWSFHFWASTAKKKLHVNDIAECKLNLHSPLLKCKVNWWHFWHLLISRSSAQSLRSSSFRTRVTRIHPRTREVERCWDMRRASLCWKNFRWRPGQAARFVRFSFFWSFFATSFPFETMKQPYIAWGYLFIRTSTDVIFFCVFRPYVLRKKKTRDWT